MKYLVIDKSLTEQPVEFDTEEELKTYIEQNSQSDDETGRWSEPWQDKIKVYQICREVKFNVNFEVVVTME